MNAIIAVVGCTILGLHFGVDVGVAVFLVSVASESHKVMVRLSVRR